MGKKHSGSSNRWLKEHFRNQYVKQAKKNGLRSRSWFKLAEIQKSDKLFHPGMTVLDLGSSPGGWSQYALTQIGINGKIIACDLLPMSVITGVDFLQGDCYDPCVFSKLAKRIGDNKVHLVMSDMSPNICGIPEVDIPRAMHLVELALKICCHVLEPGGSFLVKIFQGEGFEWYLKKIRALFEEVKVRKPNSSISRSREIYLVSSKRKAY